MGGATGGTTEAVGGARQKTDSKIIKGVEKDPPPFMLNKLTASEEFQHLSNSRTESTSNTTKILAFFHQQVNVTSQSQPGQPSFLVRTLYKSKEEIKTELMDCGLRKWLIKDTENCLLAKFAVLYKAAKCAQGYDTAQSRFYTQY